MRRVPPRRGALFASDAAGAGDMFTTTSPCVVFSTLADVPHVSVFSWLVCLFVVYIAVVTPPHRTAPHLVCLFFLGQHRSLLMSLRHNLLFSRIMLYPTAHTHHHHHHPHATPTHPSVCLLSLLVLLSAVQLSTHCAFLHRCILASLAHTYIHAYMHTYVHVFSR